MTLYAATSNPGKLAEFASSANAARIAVLALPDLADISEPVEDASTFQGNADLKAIAYSLAVPGLLVFADDSGLEVEALDGRPGIRSARFADDLNFELPQRSDLSTPAPPNRVISTEAHPNPVISTVAQRSGEIPAFAPSHFQKSTGSKDDRNNRTLLSQLSFHTNRSARFICALSLARDGQVLLRAEGTVEGQILHQPRGNAGFGYDPLFLLPSLNLTLAELPREEKWKLSHRGKAFRSLLKQLTDVNFQPDRTE
jgi:XTP/dITP diphosphohydrolase